LSAAAIAVALLTIGAGAAQGAARYVNSDGVCGGNSPCYTTIQAAIDAAIAGDTIEVADGFYDESVDVNKTLTLHGAQAGVDARTRSGAESVINHACSPVKINADNVTLDGFTVQGSTQADPCTIAGIWMNPGFSGTQGGAQILNNIRERTEV
jgi:pectin methylesterase-like acyl-CoA thioesterase